MLWPVICLFHIIFILVFKGGAVKPELPLTLQNFLFQAYCLNHRRYVGKTGHPIKSWKWPPVLTYSWGTESDAFKNRARFGMKNNEAKFRGILSVFSLTLIRQILKVLCFQTNETKGKARLQVWWDRQKQGQRSIESWNTFTLTVHFVDWQEGSTLPF